MKFLIVDDSKAMRNMVQRTLKQAGYDGHQYEFAENGMQALELVKSYQPDLVLSDWHMPVMNGLEFLKQVKAEGLDVNVGMITTEHSEESITTALDAGALFLVCKPFTPEQLSEAILSVFDTAEESETSSTSSYEFAGHDRMIQMISSVYNLKLNAAPFPHSKPDAFPYMLGMYSEAQGGLRAMVLLDNALACFLGAQQTSNSRISAYDELASSSFSQDDHDICTDILGSLASLFSGKSGEKLELRTTHLITTPLAKLDAMMASPSATHLDYMVEVPGYGAGRLLITTF